MADDDLPGVEGDGWITLTRVAAAASVIVVAVNLAIMTFVDPNPNRCPGWHSPGAGPESVWVLVVWSVTLAAFTCLMAIRWRWFARKFVNDYGKPKRMLFSLVKVAEQNPIFIPPTQLIFAVCA